MDIAEKAFDEINRLAAEHGFSKINYDGVLTIKHPETTVLENASALLSDREVAAVAVEAYEAAIALGRAHALIFSAYSGEATLVHPVKQKAEDLFEHIQYVHGLGKHPKTLEYERRGFHNSLYKK